MSVSSFKTLATSMSGLATISYSLVTPSPKTGLSSIILTIPTPLGPFILPILSVIASIGVSTTAGSSTFSTGSSAVHPCNKSIATITLQNIFFIFIPLFHNSLYIFLKINTKIKADSYEPAFKLLLIFYTFFCLYSGYGVLHVLCGYLVHLRILHKVL